MPLKHAHGFLFFLLKTLLGLTTNSPDATVITKSYFELRLKIVR